MYVLKPDASDFENIRLKKRAVFQPMWNVFLRSVPVCAALVLYSTAHLAALLTAGPFLHRLALETDLPLQELGSITNWAILGLQLLLGTPGFLVAVGLWMLFFRGRWVDDMPPNTAGLRLIRGTFTAIFALGLAAMLVYPAALEGADATLGSGAVHMVIYCYIGLAVLMGAHLLLIRKVLEAAEENCECCRTDTDRVLILALLLLAVGGCIPLFIPAAVTVFTGLSLVILGALLLYYLYNIKKIEKAQKKVSHITPKDHNMVFDDTYSRY